MVWRFVQSGGRAIQRSKLRIAKALDAKNETETQQSGQPVAGGRRPHPDELLRLRTLFNTMIALIDAYDRQQQSAADRGERVSRNTTKNGAQRHGTA
jgi:hypothetical protein